MEGETLWEDFFFFFSPQTALVRNAIAQGLNGLDFTQNNKVFIKTNRRS